MRLQETESKTLTTEKTAEAIDKAIAIDADGNESFITTECSFGCGCPSPFSQYGSAQTDESYGFKMTSCGGC
ncbi:hypothetical protein Lepto7375DRAFT_1244 [Leptolyngbya sp. PCC 7375]|nr:hypothetical protein Lepto7375DRAFT_1244 [Leptolyngbya sp. PCC 7375]